MKAQERLKLLQDTKEAWVGYAENNDTIVVEIEKGIEEIKKIKKRFALEDAFTDLAKRQDLLNKTRDSIMGLYNQIKHNVEVMGITLPDDKKKINNPFGFKPFGNRFGPKSNWLQPMVPLNGFNPN